MMTVRPLLRTQAKGKALTRKGKRLFHPIRLALTGSMSGPDIGEQLGLLAAGEFGLNLRNHVASSSGLYIEEYRSRLDITPWPNSATKSLAIC